MIRWLGAILLATLIFVLVVLVLGYLLKNNEKETKELIEQLKIPQVATPNNAVPSSAKQNINVISGGIDNRPKQALAKLERLIVNNLTCISEQQCHVVDVPHSLGCITAVNDIGLLMVTKYLANPMSKDKQQPLCQLSSKLAKVSCQANICTVIE